MRLVLWPALALALAACTSDAAPPAAGDGTPVATAPRRPDQACSDPVQPRPANATCITVVHGQLVDSDSLPVTSPIAICGGPLVCLGNVVDDGVFTVNVNKFVDLSTFVLHVYGHPLHSDMILPLAPATSSEVTLSGLPRVPRLTNKGDALPPQSTTPLIARSGPVELTLTAGATTNVLPAHEKTRELLSGIVSDPTRWDTGIVAMFALGPFSARITPNAAVALTLPPGTNVADGTTLDLVILEDDATESRAGSIRKVGSVTVTGGVARSQAGGGIDRLTWVGVRTPR